MTRGVKVRHLLLPGVVVTVAIVATITAALMALVGTDISCGVGGGTASAAGPAPTATDLREIPRSYLTIYREAGSAIDISWPFLASIGYQECGHGTGDCFVVNPSGCGGPMEIAYVRGSACSPNPSVPTVWERFRTDGDGDGKTSIFDPADAVFTAAKILRMADGAPPAGGSYGGYRQAACNYYGACSDAAADYADEVMARAVGYGFGKSEAEDSGSEDHSDGERPDAVGGRGAAGGTGTEPRGGRKPGARPRAARREPKASGPSCEAGTVSSASGNEIVRIAASQLGETEHPPGSNCQRYGPCEEWCSLFVAWVWEHAGVPLVGGTAPFAYSGSIYEWVKVNGGRVLPPTATPAPGDAVLYGSGPTDSDHIGIVERVFGDREITTIEGNYADDVARVGPFDPADAVAAGEPAPIFGYAEPPTTKQPEVGVAQPHGTKEHKGGVAP